MRNLSRAGVMLCVCLSACSDVSGPVPRPPAMQVPSSPSAITAEQQQQMDYWVWDSDNNLSPEASAMGDHVDAEYVGDQGTYQYSMTDAEKKYKEKHINEPKFKLNKNADGTISAAYGYTCGQLRTLFDGARSRFWENQFRLGRNYATLDFWGAEDAYFEMQDALGAMRQRYRSMVNQQCVRA